APLGVMLLPEKHQSLGLDIVSLCFKDKQGNILASPLSGEPAYLCVECNAHQKIEAGNLGVMISALSGQNERILYITSASDNEPLKILPGKVEIQMQMPYCCLLPGLYNSKIYVKEGIYSFDIVESFRFAVKSSKVSSQCLFYQPRMWKVINK
ncbi:MAG: Wzt carbohydrate-binding domain-containing protein, partial [Nostoc sp. C3-bin3]|nr:Wzt carbohydrate-binding domain-containing protein [Nostoc sp. C3-bin3]